MTLHPQQKTHVWHTSLSLLSRLILAVVFIAAAWPKLWDPQSFLEAISNYRVVPEMYLPYMAVILPSLEILVGLCLLIGINVRAAALLCLAMLSLFIMGMIQAMVRKIDLDCGCFGEQTPVQVSSLSVLRNIALSVPAIYLIWINPHNMLFPWTLLRTWLGKKEAHR